MAPTTAKSLLSRLRRQRALAERLPMVERFRREADRFDRFCARLDDLLLDYSKTSVDEASMTLLADLAEARGVRAYFRAMFAGEIVNGTERRAALHVAERAAPDARFTVDGKDVMAKVLEVRAATTAYAEGVRSGRVAAADGKPFTDVVNIGIGGSDLGPAMVTQALAPYHDGPRVHFVSNADSAHIADTLARLDPARTLFIVASKTFTTAETLMNATTARRWLVEAIGESAVPAHFAAVSTALDKTRAFGIREDATFGFADWVGGRYSVWSPIGLPVMIAVGAERFEEFRAGGRAVDAHVMSAPTRENLPFLLALIGYWNRAVCGFDTRAVIPYEQRLARMPAYLQQLDMESNGKRVAADGSPLDGVSGPVVFGEPGTNGQHAFFQLLHQGSTVVPIEFIVAVDGHEPHLRHQHDSLVANCLAQSRALMVGRSLDEARAGLRARGLTEADVERIAPHRVFAGNRPSVTLMHAKLTPFALGRLIALYEHRVVAEAALYGINPFDQWGVELGKEVALELLPRVTGDAPPAPTEDGSTAGLLAHARRHLG